MSEMDTDAKAYLDERRLLVDMGRDAAKSLDTWLVSLSGGTLGISLTFLKNFARSPQEPLWLGVGWCFLTAAVLATLTSTFFAQKASEAQLSILDEDFRAKRENRTDHQSTENPWSGRVDKATWAAVITFIIGVLMLLRFSFVNLPI